MLASTAALVCAGLYSVRRQRTFTTKAEMEDEAGTRLLLSYCCWLRMSNSPRRHVCMSFEHTDPRNATDFLLQAIGQFLEQQKVFESPIIQCYWSWLINPRGTVQCRIPT